MRLDSRVGLMLASGALVVGAACGGSISDPPTVTPIQSPLVGQWMLTTKMDTFAFETGLDTATCGMSPYCTHYPSTVSGAYLGGMIQVQDTFGLKGIEVPVVQASGTLTEAFCDAIDYKGLTGCTHVGARATKSYVGDITGPADSTKKESLRLNILIPDPTTSVQGPTVRAQGTYAGDSIYGRFSWVQYVYRSPPTYYGSFVMRRVK